MNIPREGSAIETGKAKRKPFTKAEDMTTHSRVQKITVFQQNGSGESKIRGIREYGEGSFALDVRSIDEPLPPVIDDATPYLPTNIDADVVLDFLTHPDLSHDLANLCRTLSIPLVASGKKSRGKGVFTPPT